MVYPKLFKVVSFVAFLIRHRHIFHLEECGVSRIHLRMI